MAESERVELAAAFPHRGAMRGPGGCVAADHPLAAGAGLRVLQDGGSAADAIVAMGSIMTVVQPQYSHLGGDAFAMVYGAGDGTVEALNSSGPAPRALDPEAYRRLGTIPLDGALAVTVPGCVDAWWKLHQRHGRLPWATLFTGAIDLAARGFPASRGLARAIPLGRRRVQPGDYFNRVFGHVAPGGGQPVVQPELARTLTAIQAGGAAAFYEDEVANACIRALADGGAKFSNHAWQPPGRWETPLAVPFLGSIVHTQPPPSRGLVLMLALQAYGTNHPPGAAAAPVGAFHAIEEAFAVVDTHAGDPGVTGFDAAAMLAGRATSPPLAAPAGRSDGDTTYMLAIDREGNAVSFIQSVFSQWGSGVFIADAGVLMNNRMRGFTLQPGHPNEIAPAKRPMHTLHSYLVSTAAPAPRLLAAGGTPGAHRQPQTNVQVLDHVLREDMDPQDALDAPRWSRSETSAGVDVEQRHLDSLCDTFREAGIPTAAIEAWHGQMGRSYLAVVEEHGVAAAADLRGEGAALVF